jgi:hypothetical protein
MESRPLRYGFVTLSLGSSFGFGDLGYRSSDAKSASLSLAAEVSARRELVRDAVGFNETFANALIHLTDRADLSLGFAYLVVNGLNLEGLNESDVSGAIITLGLNGNL